MQVTVLSPSSSYPALQVRGRTVPAVTGNVLVVLMFVQVVFKPVQCAEIKIYVNYQVGQQEHKKQF